MQYELGFSRKNPTKLKPGSFPSVNEPQKLAKELRGSIKRGSKSVSLAGSTKKSNIGFDPHHAGTQSSEGHETIEIQLCGFNTDIEGFEEAEDDDCPSGPRLVEVEILDPLNPQSNAKDHVEIIDSEGDSYVKHLELEM